MGIPFKISSIVIAKDEERNIERCLKSQAGCIDEIIVIIDASTSDRTEEIVKSFSDVKYEVVEWKGYSAAKEYALTNTTNDWVFWIDADEEVTPVLSEEIISFKESSPQHNSYDVARKAYFLNKWIKHSGWYPGRVTRLFNKNFAGFSKDKVHEKLIVKGSTGHLKNDLNHFTDDSLDHYFKKFNSYTTLAANDLKQHGKRAGISDILFRPAFLFLKMYIFRAGFLDGLHGFILAVLSSAYVFTKYCKLWELNNKEDK